MKKDLFNIDGKLALVSGSSGSGGLGMILAEGLAARGARVIIHGRDQKKVDIMQAALQDKGYDILSTVFDVVDSARIQSEAERIMDQAGIPDVIVNNAGIQIRHKLEDFPERDWDAIIDTDLKSAFLLSKAFIKAMLRRGSGKIINICSMQSELGRATIAPYAAAKGGLKMLTRAMATEWAGRGIQINGIGPGYFKTEMTRPLYENPEFDSWLCSRTPSGRWGDPEELLGALVFLASEASSYVNGQVIYVDGGLTACI